MIIGAHSIVYSRKPEADRAFLRDVLRLPSVDAGDGWLIFALPPSEVAVHPAAGRLAHELYLMCADIRAFAASMADHRIACSPVEAMPWGDLARITLPGGGALGVYQPRHARPKRARARTAPTVAGRRKRGAA